MAVNGNATTGYINNPISCENIHFLVCPRQQKEFSVLLLNFKVFVKFFFMGYIFQHSADFDLRSFLEGELNFTAFRLLDQTTDEFRRVENSFKWTVVNAAFARLVPPGYDIDNPITVSLLLLAVFYFLN